MYWIKKYLINYFPSVLKDRLYWNYNRNKSANDADAPGKSDFRYNNNEVLGLSTIGTKIHLKHTYLNWQE